MHQKISPNIFNCNVCHTRCDGKSKGIYNFENDVAFSEKIENEIIKTINIKYNNLFAFKTKKSGYPDIEIISKSSINEAKAYIEVKVQSRTFMSIERILPNSNLKPSETLALNLSDLERYFEISNNEKTPVFICWCLMNRPCINNDENKKYYFQEIEKLKQIREKDVTNSRKFKRKSGIGDVINGEHKGVVVNYHYSINELIEGIPNLKNID